MSTTSLDAARPRAAARPPRTRHVAVAMTLTAALAGGTLVAGAQSAVADEATPVTTEETVAGTPTVQVDRSRKTARQGMGSTRPAFTAVVQHDGQPVDGWVKLYVRGQKTGVKKLGSDGTVRFRPSVDDYRIGGNKVVLRVVPASSTGLGTVAKTRWIQLKPKATPNVWTSKSRKVGTKGKSSTRPRYTVNVRKWGEPVAGWAHVYIKGSKVSSKPLRSGKAAFRPAWKHYRTGGNWVRIQVVPQGNAGVHSVNRKTWVRAKQQVTRGEKVVRVAHDYVGHRYSYGGTSPATGFDCSGFTSYVYKKATGKTLPRSSSAQRYAGKRVSRSSAKKGDLVYSPGHIAIYAGNGRIIEAARPGVGVVKRTIWQSNPQFIRV